MEMKILQLPGLIFCGKKKKKNEKEHRWGLEERVSVLALLLENTCVFSNTNHNGCRPDQQQCHLVVFTKRVKHRFEFTEQVVCEKDVHS